MERVKPYIILTLIAAGIVASTGCAHRHVVLICGDKADTGFTEFWCDTARMYNIFRASGVPDSRIHVLYGDGDDWVCPANPAHNHVSKITDHPATTASVSSVFNGLSKSVRKRDKLIVWTFDHGASDGSLCLRDGNMSPATFAGLVGGINCKAKVFLMQQCFSGDFVGPLTLGSSNTVVLTAAGHETAWPADDPWENNAPCRTGEFNYYLMNAMEKKSPGGSALSVCDVTGDGHCCCIEGKYNVFRGDGQPNPGGEGSVDECAGMDTPSTPQYSSPSAAFDGVILTKD
ncbi:MAG: hypothetical protein JXP34_00660 [Planctomycetes bacterium]|nr:hypothetical protein [Planctomycetota bacterium]